MAITKISKYNYSELCNELGIELADLLKLVNKNSQTTKESPNYVQCSMDFVIDRFINSLRKQEILDIKSKKTIKYYLSFLQRLKKYLFIHYPELPFPKFNEIMLYDFIKNTSKCENGTSKSSINTYVAIIKKLCSFAYKEKLINENLSGNFSKTKIKYLPRYFTTYQLENIFMEVDKRRSPLLWKTIFYVLLGTGLRIDELVNLRIKDFQVKEQLIFTVGKGEKERYIPMFPEVKKAVLSYLQQTGVEDLEMARDGYVFSRQKNHQRTIPISARSIQDNLNKIAIKKLRYDSRYTVHSFRHTFAVNCLKAKWDLSYLQQVLGHKDPSTTSIYLKLFPKDLSKEVSTKFPVPFEELFKQILLGEDINDDT